MYDVHGAGSFAFGQTTFEPSLDTVLPSQLYRNAARVEHLDSVSPDAAPLSTSCSR